jgi:hypothetical protein
MRFLGGDHSKLFPESSRTTFRAKASRKKHRPQKAPNFYPRGVFEIGRSIMAASTTIGRRTSVWGLGEIALRVNNLDAMQKFYEEVIGLALMTRVPNCAFFKIADGYGGHTQVLALFDRSRSPGYRGTDATTSTIDHIAFEITLSDSQAKKRDWKRWDFESKPPSTHECTGALFM